MNSINDNLFKKCEVLLNLIEVKNNLNNIQKSVDQNNNDLIDLKINNNFDMNLLKTKLYFKQILENKRYVNKNKIYNCFWPKCGYKTKYYFNFKNHRLIHVKQNDTKFKCDYNVCNKIFNHIQNLIVHKRIHSGEKPFICNYINCGKVFTQSSNLIEHKRRHLNIRRYECYYNNCNKRFVTSSGRKKHINNIHSTKKLFKCLFENCHKVYGNKNCLSNHIKIKHN